MSSLLLRRGGQANAAAQQGTPEQHLQRLRVTHSADEQAKQEAQFQSGKEQCYVLVDDEPQRGELLEQSGDKRKVALKNGSVFYHYLVNSALLVIYCG